MPSADDVEEQVSSADVAGDVSELVESEKVWLGVTLEASLGCGQRLLSHEVGQCGGQGAEAYGTTESERAQAEVLRECCLADAGLAAQQDVVTALEEIECFVQPEDVADHLDAIENRDRYTVPGGIWDELREIGLAIAERDGRDELFDDSGRHTTGASRTASRK